MSRKFKIPREITEEPYPTEMEAMQAACRWMKQQCEDAIERKLAELRSSKELMAPMWDYGAVIALKEVQRVGS